ncbi:insulinase family protein [Kitasatospora sp. NPDC050463]|uniref:insulinase family protein n=1 Tax=Kitasatospora sp. NPDC050463 TaxID=3155786 RepID=UPI0033EC7917
MRPLAGTSAGLSRTTLANGLTLLTDLRPDRATVGVCVHYRAGFRADPSHRPGLAHLVEHLMFQDGRSRAGNAYFAALHAGGGTAGATTHQDYTDYFHGVPAGSLPQALAAEADRMRAPRFAAYGIAREVGVIQQEVDLFNGKGPCPGFPWPLLADVLFDLPANTRDGYGNARTLDGTTVTECADFFARHYAPANAVLTLSGPLEPAVADLVAAHFGGIPARAVPPPPAADEPPPTVDHVVTRFIPGRGPAASAIGYRLPPVPGDLRGYLAHLLMARMLSSLDGGGPLGRARVAGPAGTTERAGSAGRMESAGPAPGIDDARCGFFAPLDTTGPDALVIAVRRPHGAPPQEALAVVDRALASVADGGPHGLDLGGLIERVALEHRREHDSPTARARGLGRFETLFGQAELLDGLPDLLRAVPAADVASAAAGLLASHRAVLHVEPAKPSGGVRRGAGPARPHGSRADAGPPASGPGAVDRTGPGVGTGAAPGCGAAAADTVVPASRAVRVDAGRGPSRVAAPTRPARDAPALFSAFSEVVPAPDRPGEARVATVRDASAPLLELRLCLTLRDAHDAVTAFTVARLLARRWAANPGLGGDCTASVEGVRVHLTGWLPAGTRRRWPNALAQLLHEPVRPAEPRDGADRVAAAVRRALQDPAWALDRAALRLLHGPTATPAGLRPDIEALVDRPLPLASATLVAVGDLDPEQVAADARPALDLSPPAAGTRAGAETGVVRSAQSGDGAGSAPPDPALLVIRRPGPSFALLCAREPAPRTDPAARFLAVALVGGHPGARLTEDQGRAGAIRAVAGRDGRFGVPRVTITTAAGPENTEDALTRLARGPARRGGRPAVPTAAEITAARVFCAGQLARLDSSNALADQLLAWILLGHSTSGLADLPRAFATVSDTEVAKAVRDLFDVPAFSGVLFRNTHENTPRSTP